MSDKSINVWQKCKMIGNMIGTVIKFSYALLWQETKLQLGEWVNSPVANAVGAALMPTVNCIANAFNHFSYNNLDFAVVRETFD